MSGETIMHPPPYYSSSSSTSRLLLLLHHFSKMNNPLPLTYIEITPLSSSSSSKEEGEEGGGEEEEEEVGYLSAPMAKLQLLEMSTKSNICIDNTNNELRLIVQHHDDDDDENENDTVTHNHKMKLPKKEQVSPTILHGTLTFSSKRKNSSSSTLITLFSDDPMYKGSDGKGGIPCKIHAYVSSVLQHTPFFWNTTKEKNTNISSNKGVKCCITMETFVQINPSSSSSSSSFFLAQSCGEAPYFHIPSTNYYIPSSSLPSSSSSSSLPPSPPPQDVLSTFDKETISSLHLILVKLLKRIVYVGTTPLATNAWINNNNNKRRRNKKRGGGYNNNNKKEGGCYSCALEHFWNKELHLLQQTQQQQDQQPSQTDANKTTTQQTISPPPPPFQTNPTNVPNVPKINKKTFKVEETVGGGIIIHSPHYSHGKTTLLLTLLLLLQKKTSTTNNNNNNNNNTYVINAGALFAKYGINYIDAALECIVHSIALRAAFLNKKKKKKKVVVVLDHLDAFVPAIMSGRIIGGGGGGKSDVALPALNAMAAYLTKLSQSIQNQQIIPYPTKNPLYNLHNQQQQQQKGQVLPLHFCLVGIVTCEDDGGQKMLRQSTSSSSSSSSFVSSNILDLFGTDGTTRYRLPSTLSSHTRLKAFQHAFSVHGVRLNKEAEKMMPTVAASVVQARGAFFNKVAMQLRCCCCCLVLNQMDGGGKEEEVVTATIQDVKHAIYLVQNADCASSSSGRSSGGGSSSSGSTSAQVSFLSNVPPAADERHKTTSSITDNNYNKDAAPTTTTTTTTTTIKKQIISQKSNHSTLFASVGGNNEAKIALEDALALDVQKRRLLAAFGLSAPTGVLLYGPPGTGKTLLARDTAFALKSESSSSSSSSSSLIGDVGGAFISLRASDIVRSEVGTSEKVLVSAFETARKNAPSVVFIDEFQALFTERGGVGGGGGGSGRLASTLLQCMDDVTKWRDADSAALGKLNGKTASGTKTDEVNAEGKSGENDSSSINNSSSSRVVILGATNTPWMIDKAFLRPGRFDQVVHVGLPNLKERESILRVHVSRMKLQKDEDANHNDDDKKNNNETLGAAATTTAIVDKICKRMARECEGFSGADIAALCRASAIRCLREKNDIEEGVVEQQAGFICERHFVEARLYDVTRSSNDDLVKRISRWRP